MTKSTLLKKSIAICLMIMVLLAIPITAYASTQSYPSTLSLASNANYIGPNRSYIYTNYSIWIQPTSFTSGSTSCLTSVGNATYILGILWDYTKLETHNIALTNIGTKYSYDFGYHGAGTRAWAFDTFFYNTGGFNANVNMFSYQ